MPILDSPSAYFVLADNDGDEKEIFDLSTRGAFMGMPLRGSRNIPEPALLDFWGVKIIPISQARTISTTASNDNISRRCDGAKSDVVAALSGYEHEGRLLASWKNRTFQRCRSWEDLLEISRRPVIDSVTVVGDIGHLPYPFFGALIEMENACDGKTPRVGFLTGTCRAEVRWSVLKALLLKPVQKPQELFLFGCQDHAAPALFEGLNTLWWQDLDRGRFDTFLGKKLFLAALLSHSNGVDGNFSDGILCPVACRERTGAQGCGPQITGHSGAAREGRPSCLYSTLCQRDPNRTRRRFHPHDIRTAISYYDTCAGFLTSGAFAATSASLGLAFVTGTSAAHVTSIRKKVSSPYTALLFRSFLYDGYSLGHIIQLLNRYQRSQFGEQPSLILLGDPAFALENNVKQSPKVLVDANAGQIVVNGWKTMTFHYGAAQNKSRLIPHKQARDVLCVDLAASDEPHSDWWLLRPACRSPKVILNAPPAAAELLAFDCISKYFPRNIQFLEVLHKGLMNEGCRSGLETFREFIDTAKEILPVIDNTRQLIASRTWHYAYDLHLRDRLQKLTAAINHLNKAFASTWLETRQWGVLHKCYCHSLDQIGLERDSGQGCNICGMRLTRKSSAHPQYPKIRREMFTCIRCGTIADVPGFASIPRMQGAGRVAPGGLLSMHISFEVDLPSPISPDLLGYFGGFGSDVVQCEIKPPVFVQPRSKGGRVDAKLSLEFSKTCPSGLYSFVMVGSALLAPIFALQYITVEPAG